jgi:hypothetical protein|tara:strand:+ start:31 stop:1329 length:1299 start_codon:yes stop_codon:yes gene_type:complete
MGFLSKVFKPVSRVLDKIIPNEIKPLLPYAAAFAPVFGPTASMFGKGIMQRALLSGGANVLGQLSQEGNEGDINLLSAGIGALTGAMTSPGFKSSLEGFRPESFNEMTQYGMRGTDLAPSSFLDKATNYGIDALGKGSDILMAGGKDPFSKAGIQAALVPAATATGDVMAAAAKRAVDELDNMAGEDGIGYTDDAYRAAIRKSMEAYDATEDEILKAIEAAGYKTGGRVGFDNGGDVSFGGITEAVENIEEEPKEFLVDKLKVTMMPGQSEMRAIIEAMYNDTDGVMPDDRKNQFYQLYAPQMYRNGEMDKSEFEFIQTEILGKEMKEGGIMAVDIPLKESVKDINKKGQPYTTMVKMKEGGLMNLGGKEMDLRGGGFVPIGKKERADDVPARLSKNEFVMTADAVRAAGGGSVNEGAKRMYKVMNDLEARA